MRKLATAGHDTMGRIAVMLPALFVSASCSYEPLPLDATAVERGLAPADAETLRVQAGSLVHPILQPIVLDAGDGLSPEEAAIVAVLANPALRAVRDRRALAEAQLLQAGILPNPQLSGGVDVPVGGTIAGTVVGFSAGLSWDIAQLVSRSTRVDAATAAQASVELDIAWQEWQVAQGARIAVYRLAGLEAEAALAAETAQRLDENLDLVRRAAAEAQLTELALAAAEAAANQAHGDALEAEHQVRLQRLLVNRLLGEDPATDVRVQQGFALAARYDPPTEADLVQDLEQRRLDLVALHLGYDSQEATLHAAILEQFPRIGIGVGGGRDTGNVGSVGVGLTIDLPIFDRNQGQIAIETATRQQLFDEYVDRVFQARADVADVLEQIRSLNERIATAQAAEPGLQRLVDTYRAAMGGGQIDVLSYYTAWNELTAKRREIILLEEQLAEAQIALELAAGIYLPSAAPATAATPGAGQGAP
jgi:cobalt-zinc-cadmium efflux system outer membrane protein